MVKSCQFRAVMARFNDSRSLADRQALYEALKAKKYLGKVFSEIAQGMLRECLFAKIANKETGELVNWCYWKPFESCRLENIEETRVMRFLDLQLRHVPEKDPRYPKLRGNKERQLYALLVELDFRVKLYRQRRKDDESLPIALFPLSQLLLERLLKALPQARSLEDLRGLTAANFKAYGFQKKHAELLANLVSKLPPLPDSKLLEVQAIKLAKRQRVSRQPRRIDPEAQPALL